MTEEEIQRFLSVIHTLIARNRKNVDIGVLFRQAVEEAGLSRRVQVDFASRRYPGSIPAAIG